MSTNGTRLLGIALALVVVVALPGCWGKKCDCDEAETSPSRTLELCPPVDIVFIMDTSGSMEDEAQALCDSISAVESELRALGLDELRVALLGIVNTPFIDESGAADSPPSEGDGFDCLENTVYRVVGGNGEVHPQVPGDPPPPQELGNGNFVDPTVLDPGDEESEEFWGAATALIAGLYPWLPDPETGPPTVRIIVPISDESPQSGDTECWEADEPSVQNAIAVAIENGAIVSPILGTFDGGRDPCIRDLMIQIANATGGTFTDSGATEEFDIAESIFQIVLDACERVSVE